MLERELRMGVLSEAARQEIRVIVREAITEVLDDRLRMLGIDPEHPIEAQKNFAHLQAWRKSCDTIKSHDLKAAVGVIVTGILGALYLLIKDELGRHWPAMN